MDDLRTLIAAVLADDRLKPIHDLRLVSAAWAEAVGPGLAQRATPTKLRSGELVVAVPEAAWRQEIAFLTPEVIARVNEAIGRALVQRIRLVGGPVGPPEPAPVISPPRQRRPPRASSERGAAAKARPSAESDRTQGLDRRDEIVAALAALARARDERAAAPARGEPTASRRLRPVPNS